MLIVIGASFHEITWMNLPQREATTSCGTMVNIPPREVKPYGNPMVNFPLKEVNTL